MARTLVDKLSGGESNKPERSFRGDRLLFVRNQMQMTQPQFEKFLGFGAGVISKYENNKADPLPHQLIVMSRRCGISIDWLLGETDNPEVDASAKAKLSDAAKPRTAKEARFLTLYREGEVLMLINELSSDALGSSDVGTKNSPK